MKVKTVLLGSVSRAATAATMPRHDDTKVRIWLSVMTTRIEQMTQMTKLPAAPSPDNGA